MELKKELKKKKLLQKQEKQQKDLEEKRSSRETWEGRKSWVGEAVKSRVKKLSWRRWRNKHLERKLGLLKELAVLVENGEKNYAWENAIAFWKVSFGTVCFFGSFWVFFLDFFLGNSWKILGILSYFGVRKIENSKGFSVFLNSLNFFVLFIEQLFLAFYK